MSVDPEFARCLVVLAEGYPQVRLREGTVRLYSEALKDLTLDQFKYACNRAVKESEFFPTVACLRRMVEPSADDAAVLAWSALTAAAGTVGAWQHLEVELDDGTAAVALKMSVGSWAAFCALDEGPERAQKQKEFLAAYRQARRLPVAYRQAHRRLPGLCGPTAAGWAGRITSAGEVVQAPERPQLPAAPETQFGTTTVEER